MRTIILTRRSHCPRSRPPVPPFDAGTALQKVRAAEDAWNTRDPERVAGAYTADAVWRNRDEFITGREEIVAFLRASGSNELDYVLRKELWAFDDDRIAVRFQYEWHDRDGQWFRSYGNEIWEFADERSDAAAGGEHQRRTDRRLGTAVQRPSPGGRRDRDPAPMSLYVEQLWRYPVKSLAGEALESAEISNDGVAGDRLVHVRGPEGVRTSRRQHRLLGLRGTLGADGTPLIDGRPWSSPEALALVRAAAGEDAELVAYDGIERFDVLPLLVATDGAVAEFGRDVRRLRPNIVIGGVEGLAERDWPGATLRIGDVVIEPRLAARPVPDDDGRSRHARARSRGSEGHRKALRRTARPQRRRPRGRHDPHR